MPSLDELILHYFHHILMLVLPGVGKKTPKNKNQKLTTTTTKGIYSIRVRDKPSGLPLHSLDQLYPNESGGAADGSSTFSSSAPRLGLHLGATSNQGWFGITDTLLLEPQPP